ncbi:MAG: glycoside hydrolase family 127 protein [Defluviitaleaceae bacterium]|nr:glycoside hydrolase family 127 protein [Defluviitaleaceae bacterium]
MISRPVSYKFVNFEKGFWKTRQDVNRIETQQAIYKQYSEKGRFPALKLNWRDGDLNRPHIFFDSDVAKWIEGAAYNIRLNGEDGNIGLIDSLVDEIEAGITPEGYFNSYYQTFEPQNRFTVRANHELYCAGHLMEAAVAYADATGNTRLLDLMKRYGDYIRRVFFDEKSAGFQTPGHPEIELALIRLWEYTGEDKWLELSRHFVDTRGKNEEQSAVPWFDDSYCQDRMPVCDEARALGHSVRWGYLYSAAAGLARITKNESLWNACRRVWEDVLKHKMYITGGVGNLRHGEAFGPDYYLPNFEAYAETCASISLAFFASRMTEHEPRGEYADVFELEMYNGILAGISMDGRRFFYENPLRMIPKDQKFLNEVNAMQRPSMRQEHFSCSCCPPNVLRFYAALGGYFYGVGEDENTLFIRHYADCSAEITLGSVRVRLTQETDYPWDGRVRIKIFPVIKTNFTIAVRFPGWCENPSANHEGVLKNGYFYISREWKSGDIIELDFPMDVLEIESNPKVSQNCGCVALKRGPLVYCVEEADNGAELSDLEIRGTPEFEVVWCAELLGGMNTIEFPASRRQSFDALYRVRKDSYVDVRAKAVAYYAWGNRGEGEMAVWLRRS